MKHTTMLNAVESLVMQKSGTYLSDLQRAILTDCWQDPRITYKTIANKYNYSVKYIKQDVGPKLWQLLSTLCSEKVKKNNFKSAIERLVINGESLLQNTKDRNRSLESVNAIAHLGRNNNTVDLDLIEAPDTQVFFGRREDIEILRRRSSPESSNLITILGMGGIGKTHLAAKLVQEIKHDYDRVFWRSLTYNSDYDRFMVELLSFLTQDSSDQIPVGDRDRLDLLINCLRQRRCLIVLDNLETILANCQIGSDYKTGCEKYSKLLQIIGQYNHRSLLIITSREKPREINLKQDLRIYCHHLSGLDPQASRQLLQSNGCTWDSEADCDYLLTNYACNPLALKIASNTIQCLFEGNVSNFIVRETFVLSGISILLAQQIERLSPDCKTIIYWLTILVDPTSFGSLKDSCYPAIADRDLMESLETLLRRGIIQKKAAAYQLQPMIQEYLTEPIIEICHQEILQGEFSFLNTHALKQIDSKEDVKTDRVAFIVKPLLDKCLNSLHGKQKLIIKLEGIIEQLQKHNAPKPGYAVGNIIYLLCQLNVDLANKDFSNLIIWKTDFRNINLDQVDFSGSDLSDSVFSEQLSNVSSPDSKPDSQTLATEGSKERVKLWSILQRLLKQELDERGQKIRSAIFSPRGTIFSFSSSDKSNGMVSLHTIELLSLAMGECLQTLKTGQKVIRSIAFHLPENVLISGDENCTIELWELNWHEYIKSFREHTQKIRSVSFNPNENIVASDSCDLMVNLCSVAT